MKFSIITPSYNSGKYLSETIESVISQKGDFEIEYTIADGGSTDNSVEVMKKYDRILKDGKWPVKCLGITYSLVSEKDKGQSDAINKGLKKSHGDVVAYLNSDDMYLERTIQRAAEFFSENEDVDILYGDCRVVNAEGRTISIWRSRGFNLIDELCRNFIFQPTVFIRRRVLDRVGYFDEALHYVMDIDYWYRAGLYAKFTYLAVELAAFRITSESKTGGSRVPFVKEREKVLERFFAEYADDTLKKWRKRIFAWHYYHAGEQLYLSKELDAARKEFAKCIRQKPLSLKTCLSLLAIFDIYLHTGFFPKAAALIQPILKMHR